MSSVQDKPNTGTIEPLDSYQPDAPAPSPSSGIKSKLGSVGLIFACGSALFSDGYVNAVSGPAITVLSYIYPDYPGFSSFESRFSSLVFAGTVFGMLLFGLLVDRIGRRHGMWFSSIWLTVFSILIAGAWGAGGSTGGLFAALSAYRFLLGIAIGAEYPSGSVAASENTEGEGVKKSLQQAYFIIATNTMIDLGFVVASLVPLILLLIFGMGHLEWVWRLSLGIGALPPLVVFFFRWGMQEPEHYCKGAIRRNVPWLLIFKRYWVRLVAVSLAWLAYDFVSYPSGIYSSIITKQLIPSEGVSDYEILKKSLGYSVALNCFYLPGTLVGAAVTDRLGPKLTMIIGLLLQAVLAFIMGGAFPKIRESLGAFIVVYGLFLSFGEFGSGNNLGLLASKACGPSAVRGTLYGVAAAVGKAGAFAGSYAYPQIQQDFGEGTNLYFSGPFYIAGGLALFSAAVTFFFIPSIRADSMKDEDEAFRQYLMDHGYDVSQMGLGEKNMAAHAERGASSVADGSDDASLEK
ncbi:glycerophosphoinositol permease [Thecaphora frezii]